MNFRVSPFVPRQVIWIALALTLCSCSAISDFFSGPPREAVTKAEKREQRTHAAAAFLYHLSVADLFLENGSTMKAVANNTRVIDNYTISAQPYDQPARMTVVVMHYQPEKDDNTQRVMAPVYTGGNGDFTFLSKLVARMDKFEHTLSDIRVMTVPVQPGKSLDLSGKKPDKALLAVRAKRDALLTAATALPKMEEADIQLSLLRFFMEHMKKDAAYLCADNVKWLLAKAVQSSNDTEAVNELSQELNGLEGRLREQMPY